MKRSSPARHRSSAIALLLALVSAGAQPARAAEPAPGVPQPWIVPAVRYEAVLPEREPGALAPRSRPLLAWYRSEAPPGGLALVYSPQPRQSFPTMLMDGENRILSRGASFRWGSGWLSLLGVPPTVPAGAYELWLPDIRVPFRVTSRRFSSETIPLTGELAALRTRQDARKRAEAVELASLLEAAHPEAMHETGAFALPLKNPRRTGGYGDRREYRYDDGTADLSVHHGLDLARADGTPVASCGRGRVVMAKARVVTGWTVVIEHLPGLYSLYFHLNGIDVGVGDLVEKGQRVGSLGMTGLATGPHLHWEVQAGGTAVDPDPLVAGLPFVPGRWPIPTALPAAAGVPPTAEVPPAAAGVPPTAEVPPAAAPPTASSAD